MQRSDRVTGAACKAREDAMPWPHGMARPLSPCPAAVACGSGRRRATNRRRQEAARSARRRHCTALVPVEAVAPRHLAAGLHAVLQGAFHLQVVETLRQGALWVGGRNVGTVKRLRTSAVPSVQRTESHPPRANQCSNQRRALCETHRATRAAIYAPRHPKRGKPRHRGTRDAKKGAF